MVYCFNYSEQVKNRYFFVHLFSPINGFEFVAKNQIWCTSLRKWLTKIRVWKLSYSYWQETNKKLTLKKIYIYFFSIWVFFHEHSQFTGQQGKGEGIYLTPLYHFHLLHRHLDISRADCCRELTSAHSWQSDSNWEPLVKKIWNKASFFRDKIADFTVNKANSPENALVYANQGNVTQVKGELAV